MTHPAACIRKGEKLHDAGVNAATVLLHEVKGVVKILPDAQPSSPISMAMQCTAIAAIDAGADENAVLNALCDVVGWALANMAGPAGPARFAVFSSMSADMLARADKHAEAIHLGNLEPEGTA